MKKKESMNNCKANRRPICTAKVTSEKQDKAELATVEVNS